MGTLSPEEIKAGSEAFSQHEKRDAMYKVATDILKQYWNDLEKMTNALGILLLTWNQAFYRYGSFDFDRLEECIKTKQEMINAFKNRDISSYSTNDDKSISDLFEHFYNALRIAEGKLKDRKSPVAVAKALHLLAPVYFPLWDDKIATAYKCYYSEAPCERYIEFLVKMKELAANYDLESYAKAKNKSVLKIIDEFNYAKYTKKWI